MCADFFVNFYLLISKHVDFSHRVLVFAECLIECFMIHCKLNPSFFDDCLFLLPVVICKKKELRNMCF